MKKAMKYVTVASICVWIVASVLNTYCDQGWLASVSITFATITYHFLMRLIVGFAFNRVMHNKADYTRPWYQLHSVEKKLYQILKVKKWKNKMPSYEPDLFNPQKHTWDEIAQAMCQAELVHETIAVLSFLPLIMVKYWGSFEVFLITSICAATFDLMFAIMQRFNRPRVIKIAQKR